MPGKSEQIDIASASRLVLVRKKLNLTQGAFAEECGISQGWVSHMEVGKRAISTEVLKSLLVNHRVNPAYLLTGESPMILKKANEDKLTDLASEIQILKAQVSRLNSLVISPENVN